MNGSVKGQPFCFAGLWEEWSGEKNKIQSCTIITTEANSLLKPIHHRIPVVVRQSDYDICLSGSRDEIDALLPPYEWSGFEAIPVSIYVNNPINEGVECLSVES